MAGTPDPTPEEIAEACREIRATWNRHEEKRRRVTSNRKWTPPSYGITRRVDGKGALEAKDE